MLWEKQTPFREGKNAYFIGVKTCGIITQIVQDNMS